MDTPVTWAELAELQAEVLFSAGNEPPSSLSQTQGLEMGFKDPVPVR